MAHTHSHDHGHHHGHAHSHGPATPHPAQAAPWSILRMTVATRLGDRCGLVAFDTEVRAVVPPASHRNQLGRVTEAVYDLEPALAETVRIGGSRAQRDLFENTLLAAYWRSGRGAAAAELIERRLDRCPSVPGPRGA